MLLKNIKTSEETGREKFIILFTNNKGCLVSMGKVQKLVNTIHIQYLMDIKISVYL